MKDYKNWILIIFALRQIKHTWFDYVIPYTLKINDKLFLKCQSFGHLLIKGQYFSYSIKIQYFVYFCK